MSLRRGLLWRSLRIAALEPGDYVLRVAPIPPGPSDEATVVPIRVRAR